MSGGASSKCPLRNPSVMSIWMANRSYLCMRAVHHGNRPQMHDCLEPVLLDGNTGERNLSFHYVSDPEVRGADSGKPKRRCQRRIRENRESESESESADLWRPSSATATKYKTWLSCP